MLTAIIPSTNRANVLDETVVSLSKQTHPPDEILISVIDPERDVLPSTASAPGVRILTGPRGSTQQRNTAIENLRPDCALVSFFDDDVELHPEYLFHCRAFLREHPEVAGMSGHPVADGTLIGEIARGEAVRMLASLAAASTAFRPQYAMSGFDMTVRKDVVDRTKFDERMRLYALYEDFDFSVRCKRFGLLMRVDCCLLVHLRTGAARISPVRLGYAQFMNPFYLWWKGSQAWFPTLRVCARSFMGNVLGSVVPRQGIPPAERRKRLWGNALGLRDVFLCGAQPESIHRIS